MSQQRGLLSTALTAAVDWLIEPAEPVRPPPAVPTVGRPTDQTPAPLPQLAARPVVVVVGLARRCGATSVARGLGAALAVRDPGGACAVACASGAAGPALGVPAAGRLARVLAPLGAVRPCGRLCLVASHDHAHLCDTTRYVAPLVIDVGDPARASADAALADVLLLVASPATEPALAAVVAESLGRVGPNPVVVVNRAGGSAGASAGGSAGGSAGEAASAAAIHLPEARIGAQLALLGREPRGELGRAIARLADQCSRAG